MCNMCKILEWYDLMKTRYCLWLQSQRIKSRVEPVESRTDITVIVVIIIIVERNLNNIIEVFVLTDAVLVGSAPHPY